MKKPRHLYRESVFVYVAERRGYGVKIGISCDPHKRVAGLGVSVNLIYYKYVGYGAHRVEGRVHGALQKRRITGEWFAVPVEEALETVNVAFVAHVLEDTGHKDSKPRKKALKKIDYGFGACKKPRHPPAQPLSAPQPISN